MKTKLISLLRFFRVFSCSVACASLVASCIEIFRDKIWNRILVFSKYNFKYVYFTFFFICYYFNCIKIKEIFKVRYKFISWNRIIEMTHIFRNVYIFYAIFRVSSVVCLLFTFFGLSFIFCSRLETLRTIFHFQEIGFVFKHVSTCRAYPLSFCYSMRKVESRSKVTLFVDSSWQLDVWNFLETCVLFSA